MRLYTDHTSARRESSQRPLKGTRRRTSSKYTFSSNSPDEYQRPIIFLAHSLGGIVLKQVRRCIGTNASPDVRKAIGVCNTQGYDSMTPFRDILVSTHAVLFFGTPHSGTNGVELLRFMNRLASVFLETNDVVLKHLTPNSPELDTIQKDYVSASGRIDAIFFYEEYATPIVGGHREMVSLQRGLFHYTEGFLDCPASFRHHSRSSGRGPPRRSLYNGQNCG